MERWKTQKTEMVLDSPWVARMLEKEKTEG